MISKIPLSDKQIFLFSLFKGKTLKIDAIEKNIEPFDVYEADEAFISATPFCMLPVTSLNSVLIKDGKVGPIFTSIIKKWSKNKKVDIIDQIKKWNEADAENLSAGATPYRFRKK